MNFGLAPEFSTPVQKPVENRVLRRTKARNRSIYGHFSEAKDRRARFDVFSGAPFGAMTGSTSAT